MMTIEESHKKLQQWYDNGCVGNITVFRAPRSDYVDMIGETTIKMFELDEESRDVVRKVFDVLDSEKIELFKDRDGNPDRARVVRRY
jgi:uncharacterized protein YeeX (DUF496 family)